MTNFHLSRRRRTSVVSKRSFTTSFKRPGLKRTRRCTFEPLEIRQVLAVSTGLASAGLLNDASNEGQIVGPLAAAKPLFPQVEQAFEQVSNLDQYTEQQLQEIEQWVVRAAYEIDGSALSAAVGVTGLEAIGELGSTFLYTMQDGETTSDVVSAFGDLDYVEYFYPLVRKEIKQRFVPNDPLIDQQWHLINTGDVVTNPDDITEWGTWGEDIRVEPVWDEFTGEGVVIAIVDDALQRLHPDLAPNYDPAVSTDFAGLDGDPSPNLLADFHGTAVGGIAAGAGNNGEGITGVAFNATIGGIRLISRIGLTDFDVFSALSHLNDQIDIYNNSFGPPDAVRNADPFGPLATDAILRSATTGRNGLGNVHIVAAGNGAGSPIFDSSNFDGFANSRYSIAVGAIGHDGVATAYSEAGPNVFVVAPSGTHTIATPGTNFSRGSGIVTTDLMGNNGYNVSGVSFPDDALGRDFLPDTNYTTRFNGTSASAPIVSGVVALMLEANPNLTYRDVEHILARSARQNNPEDVWWQTNFDTMTVDPLPPPWDFGLGGPTSPYDPLFPGSALPEPAPRIANSQGIIPRFTNSAGFTVHDNPLTDTNYAYGHGAVDARLAVELAKNWQTVPIEASIELPRIITAGDSGVINGSFEIPDTNITVPGGIGGEPFGDCDTEAFYDLWWNGPDDPDDDPPDPMPINCRAPFEIAVFPPDTLAVEHVEVELGFRDLPPEVSDNLRITLISPEGTHSDMVTWAPDPLTRPAWNVADADGEPLTNFTWRFTSARHWGERTGTDLVDEFGFQPPWRIVFSNWVGDEAELDTYKVDFFGTDLTGRPGRVQGLVGIDANSDQDFNFTGLINPDTGEYVRDIVAEDPQNAQFFRDPAREPLASEAIVYVDLDHDAQRDNDEPMFMTGADGNYYFDLPVGTYTIRVDAPPGMEIVGDDSYTVQLGFNPDTGDFVTRARERNFLVAPEPVTFKGTIFADFNGTGTFERETDALAEGFVVFADLNGNGEFDFQDTNFNLRFDANPNPADVNGDRIVDRADGDIIRQNLGTIFGATRADGDTDGDADVDGEDLLNWLNAFGEERDRPIDPIAITGPDGTFEIEVAPGQQINPTGYPGFRGVRGTDFYTVMVLDRPGWTLTNPTGPLTSPDGPFYRLFTTAGETVEDLDFFFDPDLSILEGVVFHDSDADGVKDDVESGLGGFTVYIDLDRNGRLGLGEPQAITDQNGRYRFERLDPDQYQVRIAFTSQQGEIWAQTTPLPTEGCPDPACLQLFPEQTSTQDFGLHRAGTIFGFVYHDLNGNATPDTSEPALAGATVFVDMDDDGILDDGEPRFVTGANGRYEFRDLEEGSYTVRLVQPPAFEHTQPSTGAYRIDLDPSAVLSAFDFGVEEAQPQSAIRGIVFDDLNTNTRHDEGEPLLGGYTVYVDVNGNGSHDATEPFAVTGTQGAYLIDPDLPAGTYIVRVQSAPGLQLQSPYIGSRPVRLGLTGADDIDFWVGDTTTVDVGSAPPPYPDATHGKPTNGAQAFLLGNTFANDGVVPFAGGGTELIAGQTYTIQVTAVRAGAFLQAWVDYNRDGDWDDPGERIATNRSLAEGANNLTFTVPQGAVGGESYARFRLGEFGLDSPTSAADVGEVEDYRVDILASAAQAAATANLAGTDSAEASGPVSPLSLAAAFSQWSAPADRQGEHLAAAILPRAEVDARSLQPQVVPQTLPADAGRDLALANVAIRPEAPSSREVGASREHLRPLSASDMDAALSLVLSDEDGWLT